MFFKRLEQESIMRISLGLFAVLFSLAIFMIIPAYADVTSATLVEESFTLDDQFTIKGTIDDFKDDDVSKKLILSADLKGPSGEKLTRSAWSKSDRTFAFVPIQAKAIFKTDGIYEVNVFTPNQTKANGVVFKIQYDKGSITLIPDYVVVLNEIGNKTVEEMKKLSFTAKITDSSVDIEEYSLNNAPQGTTINKKTGVFSWTPTEFQIGSHIIEVIVKAGPLEDKETITVTVTKKPTPKPESKKEPKVTKSEPEEPKELGLASFVDPKDDPQSYVDRYNNEENYKKWFDEIFAEYDSIYHAVGMDEPTKEELMEYKPAKVPASFVDPANDPQIYVDRYNNEENYKNWFDDNYAEYDSIYHAVGMDEPVTVPASFVDPVNDPQIYVDRYNNEENYKNWFDDNYAEYDSIYHAVGMDEPEIIEEKVKKIGECGPGTDLVDGMCMIADNYQKEEGGGCLIATATYGTEMAPQVQLLREIRDNQLMGTQSGISFMTGFNSLYYSFSPQIADMERENPLFKEAVKIGITPLLSSLSIMTNAETETEVLGYGIGIILMNLGMYVGIPGIVIFKIGKHIKI